ncbi:putative Histidine kinase [Desulfamplus magnetovallimortis]|uniref:Chemotaxis protein CheA n=1 Tax=Desulfamplus magnetovallimortis TaxID=1246637 RepID=A0A1W1HI28_9BACT|nr:chemotaxis protein CheA [Desulfamplus magnetovallimortis]SLM32083.1 putative Histidine kinase [Desulfamplus magnetovallimortis]
MENYDIDPQILAGFIDETTENLQAVEEMLETLEKNPDDMEIVNTIFRPIHSLKGTSPFFGLVRTKELSHSMENLLDAVRKGQKKVSKKLINTLMPGLDQLLLIFERIRSGKEEVDDINHHNSIRESIETLLTSPEESEKALTEALPPTEEPEIIDVLIKNLNAVREIVPLQDLYIIDQTMELLFRLSAENELENEIIKENAKKEIEIAKEKSNIEAIAKESDIGTINKEDDRTRIGTTSKKPLKEITKEEEERRQSDRRSGDRRAGDRRKGDRRQLSDSTASVPVAEMDKTMRVSEKSIDSFLEYVGELVVVEEMFNHLQKKIATLAFEQNLSQNFKRVIETFSNLSESLRTSIMEIRSVPAKFLLQKAPRLARSTAEASGKMVNITLEGENIKIDKSYLELLDAPLTHMVRNAVDHGIELPEERTDAGKTQTGTLRIAVEENKDNINLIVSEDGKGLDYEAIGRKALELGLIKKGEKPSHSQIVDLLFQSGVSTAKEITDISGRGVGMDVVKKNIDTAGGTISVESHAGIGTTFTITLPKSVSTQIVDGFLVKCGKETYVLPMEIIGESFVPAPKDITSVKGKKGEVVMRRGTLMEVIKLWKVLNGHNPEREIITSGKDSTKDDLSVDSREINCVMITVNTGNKPYALCVDQILGVQKVVVKHVEALPVEKNIFEGAAMMGDGSVAMIISTEGLRNV